MSDRQLQIGTGQIQRVWPMVLLLVAATLVPTACVLYFMGEAMRNERLAVRQKLEDAYRGQLLAAREALDDHWGEKFAALASVPADAGAVEVFARLVEDGICDSAIIYDDAGRIAYPSDARVPGILGDTDTEDWREAARLEYEWDDPEAAAQIYRRIADRSADAAVAAGALAAQARCLASAGRTEEAIAILAGELAGERYRHASDASGRFIAPGALLLAVHLTGDSGHGDHRATLELLVERLADYAEPAMPAGQRRFLMGELEALAPETAPFATFAAEELAAEYIESASGAPDSEGLAPVALEGVWRLASADKAVIALFREERLIEDMNALVRSRIAPARVTANLAPPSQVGGPEAPFLFIAAGRSLPDWRLELYLEGPDPFTAAADRQVALYLWTALVVIVLIVTLALGLARHVGRQMRLARLKNDLIATVSHELKTPLSSMRVLVDTLLAGSVPDERQVREYLQLIAKENVRLSRLIDNFLTFSRMERNRRAFEFAEVEVAEIAAEAADAVRDRFERSGCQLDVEVAPGLPPVSADHGALLTVALNLLDNAYKYTGEDKRIALRAYPADGEVCMAVEDNGVGLARRDRRRIFDRFYQVDRTLSREAGGCGLGLAIVRFIVRAHGGSVSVTSEPGKGSTFTVKLPAADAEQATKQ